MTSSKEYYHDSLVSLHKYWIQSNSMKELLHTAATHIKNGEDIENIYLHYERTGNPYIHTYRDFWLATLSIVIDGYKQIGLQESALDILLTEEIRLDLKGFRNSTFHFESQDERNKKFAKIKNLALTHIEKIHCCLGSFLFQSMLSLLDSKPIHPHSFQKEKEAYCRPTMIPPPQEPIRKVKNLQRSGNTEYIRSIKTLYDYYFNRADIMKRLFYDSLSSQPHDIQKSIYMGLWYASLYSVVEGYQKLSIQNPMVDKLLTSENVDCLRKYRHSVTGYHEPYYNQPLIMGLLSSNSSVVWVRKLHDSLDETLLKESVSS